jgi:polysaccharide biosynthesis protein PslH
VNILYIVPYKFVKPTSGGQIASYHEIKSLSKVVKVIAVGVIDNDESKDFTLLPLLKKERSRYYDWSSIERLGVIIVKSKIDIVITEHPYLGWLLVMLRKKYKVKIAVRSQNVEALRFKDMGKKWWPILRVYERWVHNKMDYVFPITEDDFAYFEAENCKAKLINFPFGTDAKQSPSVDERQQCQATMKNDLGIAEDELVIMYNGNLGYLPNVVGLDIILKEANPILLKSNLKYKIVICGSKLDASYKNLKSYKDKNIIYCGFVDDIASYFKGTDLFLNPVFGGGGIKTKLVDALSFGTTCISSVDGAKGLLQKTAGEKLHIVADKDGKALAEKILELSKNKNFIDAVTPNSYFEYYNWFGIAEKVIKELEEFKKRSM